MGHSRITLAILFALGLLGTAQADEPGQDPFMVELKGPDEPAPSATLSPGVQPVAGPVTGGAMESYGPIRPTDTLWSLANKYRPDRQVSVYQTMVAIYDKNPRSFADGNINHLLVGSRILLPSAAEASHISDVEARRRFKSDNASWKGLGPKYLANKHQIKPVQPLETRVAAAVPAPPPKAAPAPAAVTQVATSQPVSEAKEVAKAGEAVPSQAVATVASAAVPAPLPEQLAPVGKPETEMALALEDANAQLGQVTEMNQRLKLRLQSLTDEVETFKAQLQAQNALEKEIAELKAHAVPPAPNQSEPARHSEWMGLVASPLNLAMIILLPVLLVLALVTLWLRARSRRELEAQERQLSESTAMVMGEEKGEPEPLMVADDATQPSVVSGDTPDTKVTGPNEDAAMPLSSDAPGQETGLAPERFTLPAAFATGQADGFKPAADEELLGEEALQTPQFAGLDAELALEGGEAMADRTQEDLASFDLSDFAGALTDAERAQALRGESGDDGRVDELLIEQGATGFAAAQEPEWQAGELALAQFGEGFAELSPQPASVMAPRPAFAVAQAQDESHGYVDITKLLAEAEASSTEQEPYRGFSLNVGLDGFPEVLPEFNGIDVDADDGGVGAKLDLARAYLEIDDKESAVELLQEAAAKGSDHQRAEAEQLLRRLG